VPDVPVFYFISSTVWCSLYACASLYLPKHNPTPIPGFQAGLLSSAAAGSPNAAVHTQNPGYFLFRF